MDDIDKKDKISFYVRQRRDLGFYRGIREWLIDNGVTHDDYYWNGSTDTITFYNEADAVAFRLKYGDTGSGRLGDE